MTKGVIIVLGSPNDEHGSLSSIALERCHKAWEEYCLNPDYFILPTGGWGAHFNVTEKPHGDYLKSYLLSLGIPEARFLECAKSSNTIEDAILSRAILAAHVLNKLIVVTSDFHEARARIIFKREFPGLPIRFSTCKTDLTEEELEKLRAHERAAVQRLREDRHR